jgi:hypothetical protein
MEGPGVIRCAENPDGLGVDLTATALQEFRKDSGGNEPKTSLSFETQDITD